MDNKRLELYQAEEYRLRSKINHKRNLEFIAELNNKGSVRFNNNGFEEVTCWNEKQLDEFKCSCTASVTIEEDRYRITILVVFKHNDNEVSRLKDFTSCPFSDLLRHKATVLTNQLIAKLEGRNKKEV